MRGSQAASFADRGESSVDVRALRPLLALVYTRFPCRHDVTTDALLHVQFEAGGLFQRGYIHGPEHRNTIGAQGKACVECYNAINKFRGYQRARQLSAPFT